MLDTNGDGEIEPDEVVNVLTDRQLLGQAKEARAKANA